MSSSNYLRSLAAEANERLGVGSQSWTARASAALAESADHIDNLYSIIKAKADRIAQAPHADYCETVTEIWDNETQSSVMQGEVCTCWKAGL